jgi:hypothetical protein
MSDGDGMKKKKYPSCERRPQPATARAGDGRRQMMAYGDTVTICVNAGCIMRKKAKCFGFEGCPGFMGR